MSKGRGWICRVLFPSPPPKKGCDEELGSGGSFKKNRDLEQICTLPFQGYQPAPKRCYEPKARGGTGTPRRCRKGRARKKTLSRCAVNKQTSQALTSDSTTAL